MSPDSSTDSPDRLGSVDIDEDSSHAPDAQSGFLSRISTRFDLSLQIVISLIFGIGCGIFFGEYCAWLTVVGDAFVGLLRMTVLPFIAVTLIASLGRLTMKNSRRLAFVGAAVLLVLWAICLTVVWLMPFAYPQWISGSFFSTALIDQPSTTNLLDNFIPSNIFSALANNQVPAIVVFSICCGIALSKIDRRESMLQQLNIASEVLLKISRYIARLAPIGIFAISAGTAGTISLDEISRLQTFLLTYCAGALFIGFVVLPTLITTITPLSYKQVFQITKEPILTAFATGKLIIVLPMLIENTERLLSKQFPDKIGNGGPAIDMLYGTAYPFPHVGKLLSLSFIPFAAWFLGTPLQQSDYLPLMGSGVVSFFGGPIVAIPFLLDQHHLPHDMFQLFLVSGVFGERIGDPVGVMHLCALTVISVFGFSGHLRFQWWEAFKNLVFVVVIGFSVLFSVRILLYELISTSHDRVAVIEKMQLLDQPKENDVIQSPMPNPTPLREDETVLERIRRRGKIRVGYNEDSVPFVYFNGRHELVGYDVEMAHALAHDLAVELEFVRFDRDTLNAQLADDHFDVVMSGLVGTLERSQIMEHTQSYMDVNLALVTLDFRAREFQTRQQIAAQKGVRIGYVDLSNGFVDRIQHALPDAELVEIESNRHFFVGKHQDLDALLISAESGSAYTLMYSHFEVVIPEELRVQLPLVYAVTANDADMKRFLEHWMNLRKKDGTTAEYYDHWVLGKSVDTAQPRWSVIRDYLHWVE